MSPRLSRTSVERPKNSHCWRQRLIHGIAFVNLLLLAGACATPVGVARLDPQEVYRGLTSNVLSRANLSDWSV